MWERASSFSLSLVARRGLSARELMKSVFNRGAGVLFRVVYGLIYS